MEQKPINSLSASTRERYERRNKNSNKCLTCGIDIYPHWKYCQEHTRGNILLDMDTHYISKAVQEKRLSSRLSLFEKMYAIEHADHQLLKEQYAELQENFHTLARDGFEKWFAQHN